MSVFIEHTIKCQKCKKKYKSYSGMENWSIMDRYTILPFCKECSIELKKLINNWIKKTYERN